MQVQYKRKYLIVGLLPKNRKLVRDAIRENTTLKVSPRKLRPVQLAHSDSDVAIGDPNMAFNNANVSEQRGSNDVETMRKYNIKLIYVSSFRTRESHVLVRLHIKEYEDMVELDLPEVTFEQEGLAMKGKLAKLLKKYWVHV